MEGGEKRLKETIKRSDYFKVVQIVAESIIRLEIVCRQGAASKQQQSSAYYVRNQTDLNDIDRLFPSRSHSGSDFNNLMNFGSDRFPKCY